MKKTALITGSSSGIGEGVAFRLAKDGWKTLIHGRRKIPIEETVAAISAAGGAAEGQSADMADMTEVAELSEWAISEGDLHAVFHCAAKFTYGPVSTDRFEDCDLAIDSVLRATIRLTAHTLPSIRQNKGAYVYLCGPTSWTGWKNHAIHCATRHAQAGFAKGCEVCEFKTHCTTSTRRVVTRWEHEHLVDELQQRLDENPQAMRQRRETVEHPFGTIKMRMGATHFVMKRLKNVKTEKALNVLAYNLTRLMTILGPQQLIQAMKA